MSFRVNAPGKVNLCLFLGPHREDGRHELVTLFEAVSLFNRIVCETATGASWEDRANLVEGLIARRAAQEATAADVAALQSIVEQMDATTLIVPGAIVTVDPYLNLLLELP